MKCASAIRAFERPFRIGGAGDHLGARDRLQGLGAERLPQLGAGHRAADHRGSGLIHDDVDILDGVERHPVLLEIDAHHDLRQAADHDGHLLALEIGGARDLRAHDELVGAMRKIAVGEHADRHVLRGADRGELRRRGNDLELARRHQGEALKRILDRLVGDVEVGREVLRLGDVPPSIAGPGEAGDPDLILGPA